MHRRSQRTSAFKSTSPLTRMERLFFWCAQPPDGHYEFSFIEEEFISFMKTDTFKKRFPFDQKQINLLELCLKATTILNNALETEVGCILLEEEYLLLSQIDVLKDSLLFEKDLFIFPNFHSEKLISTKPDVKYWLNELDRNRFKTYKPKNSDKTEVPMPGTKKQKLFYNKRFSELQKLDSNELILKYPDLLLMSRIVPSKSLGRLSKEGRYRVKKNLLELYKYFLYVQHRHNMASDLPYWKNELLFIENAISINLLLWQTNCLRTLVVI
jgi:hypothetical protein